MPPPQKLFSILSLKMATFRLVHSGRLPTWRGGPCPPTPLGSAVGLLIGYLEYRPSLHMLTAHEGRENRHCAFLRSLTVHWADALGRL